MALSLATKVIVFACGGAGAFGTLGLGYYYYLRDETIRFLLTSLNEDLSTEIKEFQISFNELKDDGELIGIISKTGEEIDLSPSSIEKGTRALMAWCKDALIKKVSNNKDLIEKVKKYCTKPPLTIGEKINRNGKRLVNEWNQKFNALKSQDSKGDLLKDLQSINSAVTDLSESSQETNAREALKKWCTDIQKYELANDKDKSAWKKLEARCLKS